jgi:hypothetical protein
MKKREESGSPHAIAVISAREQAEGGSTFCGASAAAFAA